MASLRLIVLALVALALLPTTGLAAPALNGEFAVSGTPKQLTLGPDGNVWFTLTGSTANKEFGSITPAGVVTEYDSPSANPNGITTGPDNRLWIVHTQAVVRVDPATPDAGQAFPINDLTDPRGITAGPDGNLWAASADKVFKISTAGAVLDTYTVTGMAARGIAAGGDGNLWVVDFGQTSIVRITTSGTQTPFPVGGGPQEITAGPQGQLAFGNPGAMPQVVGRIAYDGTVQPTQTPNADPFGIVFGQDGAYWTAQFAANSLGRITPAGAYTQLPLTAASGPRYVNRGAGDTLWVALETAQKIARITGVTPPPPSPPTGDRTRPVISSLALTRARFRAGPGTRTGTTIRIRSSEAGRATLQILRARPGRIRAGRCVPPRPALRTAKRCSRYVSAGTLTRNVKAGLNALAFSGRLKGRRLAPGAYRLKVTIRDAAKNRSLPRRAGFRILPR